MPYDLRKVICSHPSIPFTIVSLTYCGKHEKGKKGEDWKHHHWSVTLGCEGREYVMDYFMGEAFIGKWIAEPYNDKRAGHWVRYRQQPWNMRTSEGAAWRNGLVKQSPIPPTVMDLSSCLKTDVVSVQSTFADWCDNFGYNSDSITDRELYFTHQKVFDSMRQLLRGHFQVWLETPEEN